MCCMMPKKESKKLIYFIFKDSTIIFIPEKSGFKDLTTILKSYPSLINLSMRKKIDSLVHNFQFHVHSSFDYNRVSIPEIWFIKDKRTLFFSSPDPKLKFGLRSRSKQLQVIDLLTVFSVDASMEYTRILLLYTRIE